MDNRVPFINRNNVPLGKTSSIREYFLKKYSGASAAYSLRQLSTPATDVVRVRRSSDNTEQSFSANEVRGSRLLDFVVPTDVQALYSNSMYFDGVNGGVSIGNIALSTNQAFRFKTMISFNPSSSNFDRIYSVGAFGNCEAYYNSGKLTVYVGGSLRTITYDFTSDLQELDINYNGTNLMVSVDGVQIYTNPLTHSGFASASMFLGFGSAHLLNGVMLDVEVYVGGVLNRAYEGYGNTDADWVDQIGSNDGTVFGSPALFTGQGFSGFATTWYDQSVPTSKCARLFNGNGDRIEFSEIVNLKDTTRPFRFKFKAYTSSLSGVERFIAQQDDASNFNGFSLYSNGSNLRIDYRANGATDGFTADLGTLSPNTFYDIEILYDGSKNLTGFNINVDGVARTMSKVSGVDTITGNTLGSTSIFQVGRSGATNSYDLTGSVFNLGYDDNNTGAFDSYWIGDGYTDDNWVDTSGSNDGTVFGTKVRLSKVNATISNDATQETTANQPFIVDDGVLVTKNEKPALSFDGIGGSFDINGLVMQSVTYGAFCVASIENNTVSFLKTIFDCTDAIAAGFSVSYGNTENKLTPFWFDGDDTTANVFSGGTNLTTFQTLYSVIAKTGASTTHFNGVLNDTLANTWTLAGTNSFTKSTIGYDQSNANRMFDGKIQEIILYQTDEADNRAGIEANINRYYNIY